MGENTKSADPAGSVPVTVSWRVVVAVSPASLVTRSVTAKVPARVNRCVVDGPVPVLPSPKSQLYVAPRTCTPPPPGPPGNPGPATVVVAVKVTSWLIDGVVGEKVKFAVVGGSVIDTLIVREEVDVALESLVTESVTVNVPPRL